jgi:very-short-patch-repair endonuclease
MKFRKHIYLPYSKDIQANVKKLRNNMTEEEKKLWYQYLRSYPVRFTRQKAIDKCIVDFYCAKCRLGVEIDGSQHATEKGFGHDEERTRAINAYGVTIIRFTNEQIRNDFIEVCRHIDIRVKELFQSRLA